MVVIPVQSRKAHLPISLTAFGSVTVVSPLQLAKVAQPIVVTLSGIVIEVRSEQSTKAQSPILVTLFGITVFLHPKISVFVDVSIIALLLSRESYTVLPDSTMMEARPAQPQKADAPIIYHPKFI